jgi:hypothetical protein
MHLWVSVKQGGPDPTAEGSSSTVDAWYDTNVSQDIAVTCNGRWQFASVDLGRHDGDSTGRPLGYLHNGKAWLQFCLVQGTSEEDGHRRLEEPLGARRRRPLTYRSSLPGAESAPRGPAPAVTGGGY